MDTGTLHYRLMTRLALVREDLEEVMGRLTDDMLPWAPREGMRTIAGQLSEIAGTEVQLMCWIRDGKQVPYKEAMDFGDPPTTLARYREILDSVRAKTLAYIDALSEAELEEPVPFPEGWFEALRLPMVARSEAFRSLAQHEWYHTGQLVSYVWSRGDDPYSW